MLRFFLYFFLATICLVGLLNDKSGGLLDPVLIRDKLIQVSEIIGESCSHFFLYFFLVKIPPNGFSRTISGVLYDPGPLNLRIQYHPQDKYYQVGPLILTREDLDNQPGPLNLWLNRFYSKFYSMLYNI